MWRYIVPALVFLVLVGAFAVGLTKDPWELPSALMDRPVPEFELEQLANPQANFSQADLLGQVTLVNAWGSWCVTCLAEHEQLLALSQQHGVNVVGLNYRDQRGKALAWLKRLGDPYLFSGFDPSGQTAIDWGVAKAPESFVVDKQGVVRLKVTGAITDKQIADELLPLIRRLEEES